MANYDELIYTGAIKGGATPTLSQFIVSQARHESADYTNNQTRTNNNPFGFKYSKNSPYAKEGNISPEGDKYAKYDSVEDATKDYVVRWYGKPSKKINGTRLQEFNKYKTVEEYARALKDYGYYADSDKTNDEWEIQNYIRGIKNRLSKIDFSVFAQKIKENKANVALAVAVLLGLSVYLYIVTKKK